MAPEEHHAPCLDLASFFSRTWVRSAQPHLKSDALSRANIKILNKELQIFRSNENKQSHTYTLGKNFLPFKSHQEQQ